MNASSGNFDNLQDTIYLLCDACVHEVESDEERLELEQLVQSNSAARELYLDFFLDSAALRLLSLARLDTELLGHTCESLIDLKLLRQLEQQPDALGAELPQNEQSQASHQQPHVIQLLRGLGTWAVHSPIYSTLIVAGIVYGLFGYLAWDLRPEKTSSAVGTELVAVISDSSDVTWSADTSAKANQASIRQGEALQIDSGTLEFELTAGTKLVVEGPAAWSIDCRNSIVLRTGKLMASVPEQAIGFTVETPTAKVVDLGTEFEVEVGESGTTEVQVLKGNVHLHPGGLSGGSVANTPVKLSAGTARRVSMNTAGQLTVREITPNANRTPRIAKAKAVIRLPIVGAMASSETNVVRQANNLINGSGLKDELHTNSSENTMWLTALNHVKGEFVQFDLGRVRSLESMKVWNFNENIHPDDGHITNLFAERGVALADIYVSKTGKGDPVSQPDEWRLVVNNQKFSPADGTDEYATPDVIPLRNVEARFAAIVIRERHHPERMHENGDCVGLSEVQFFGQAIESPPTRAEKH